MNIAQAFNSGDRDRAIEWLEQCKKWNALSKHILYLMPSFDCVPIPEIVPFIGLTDYLQVSSDWRQADGIRHANANGPNSAFVQVARYFYEKKLGPFFWCEPDCCPLHPYSFDKLEEAYLACGKPFMGGYAPAPVPHLNGNSVYPERAALIPTLVLPMRSDDGTRDIAFDVAAAREILPQAHCTELIQHLWRGPSFTSQADFDTRIRKDALFYHQCRDGSLYKYLNGNKDVPGTIESAALNTSNGTVEKQLNAAPSVTSITTSPVGNSIEVQRARAAKARVALAAKRATGWKPTKKRKRKRGKAKV